jgi:hypothetical protein
MATQVPTNPRELAKFVGQLTNTVQAQQAKIASLETKIAAGGGSGGALANLGNAGNFWTMLDRIAWADPDIVRSHSLELAAAIQGAVPPAAVPVDGPGVEAPADIVADRWFIVRRITGFVDMDSSSPLEDTSPIYVSVQLEDGERQTPAFRNAVRMASLVGTAALQGQPMEFDEVPLAFLPRARIVATFTPLAGFPVGINHQATALTTRLVGLRLDGALVAQKIVDTLLAQNRLRLVNQRLLPVGG